MGKVYVLMYMDSDDQTYANKVFLGVAGDREGIERLRDEVLEDGEVLERFYEFNERDLEIEEIEMGSVYLNF